MSEISIKRKSKDQGLIYFSEDWQIKDAHTKWNKSVIPTDQELYPQKGMPNPIDSTFRWVKKAASCPEFLSSRGMWRKQYKTYEEPRFQKKRKRHGKKRLNLQ
ncbi:Very-Long-Chain Enoyl-Coa Reductase [Manis pentadactyla]|nr:Very-Long-Chain Enoyl-Coa Reductase [Manis pentadactyla]